MDPEEGGGNPRTRIPGRAALRGRPDADEPRILLCGRRAGGADSCVSVPALFLVFVYLFIWIFPLRGVAPADAGGEAADRGLIRVIASVIPARASTRQRQLWIVFPTQEL